MTVRQIHVEITVNVLIWWQISNVHVTKAMQESGVKPIAYKTHVKIGANLSSGLIVSNANALTVTPESAVK